MSFLPPSPTPCSPGCEPISSNDPLEIAADYLKTDRAVHLESRLKGRQRLDAIQAAELRTVYGDKFVSNEGEPVVNVDSPVTSTVTHNHNYPPQAQGGKDTAAGWLQRWPISVLAAGLVMGAAGAWLVGSKHPDPSPVPPIAIEPQPVLPPTPVPTPVPVKPKLTYDFGFGDF